MDLASQYQAQTQWRRWQPVLSALPIEPGQRVLDLGCAIGEQAAMIAERGARVIGIDSNPDLLSVARARQMPDCRFIQGDLRHPEGFDIPMADGIWCSFCAAYFPLLEPFLRAWTATLRPGGWIALLEIDDLFAHEPLAASSRELLRDYGRHSRREGRYDFWSGRHLAPTLERLGFVDLDERTLGDDELSFQGAATDAVLSAWTQRLERMILLQEFAGESFADLREDLLRCLASTDHTCSCRVVLVTGARASR